MKMKVREKNFRKRLFRSFIIVAFVPMVFMSLFYYFNLSSLATKKIDKSVKENLDISGRLIDSTVSTFISMTNYMVDNEEVQNILRTEGYINYEDRFKDVQKIYKIANSVLATQSLDVPIHVIDKNRKIRFSTTDYLMPVYEDSKGNFFDILDENEGKGLSFIHRRVDGKDSKDIVMAIGRQIRGKGDGKVLGYIISDVYDEYFNDILENTNIYEGNNVYVLDKNGYIITDKSFKNKTGFKFYEEYLGTILKDNKGTFNCVINNANYKAYFTTSEHTGLKIIEVIPRSTIYKERELAFATFLLFIILCGVMGIIASYLISKRISEPINRLSNLMKKVEEGNRNVNFDLDCDDDIGKLGKSFNDMVKEINRLIEEVYMKQYLLQEAEFKALKAQVNPHFLYNTLESIHWMAKLKDFESVSTMVTTLGKFLRYSISSRGDIVSVSQEIEQIENYLTIQRIRYRDKFTVNIDIEETLYNKNILRFLIQPIVENSIIHGLEQKIGKGIIIIKGYIEEGCIIFEIKDNGVGMGNSKAKGEGIGMDNVNRRIKIHYGEEYGVYPEKDQEFTSMKIRIPVEDKIG